MKFSDFSSKLDQLEQTNSRLEMMYQLADLYKEFKTEEITISSYLMQGSLVPAYLSLEFQLSIKMILRSLAQVQGEIADPNTAVASVGLFGEVDETSTIDFVTKKYKESGDIGSIAFDILTQWHSQQKTSDFTVSITQVFEKLVEIAREGGTGSQDRKLSLLTALLKEIDPTSAKYVARVVIGKLRLGFSAMTILDALSWAVLGSKDHRKVLETAYQKRADVGELATMYLSLADSLSADLADSNKENNENKAANESAEFAKNLSNSLAEKYVVATGVPVVPALCQRLNTAKEIIEKMDEVIVEPKYDGLRIQIHYSKEGFEDGSIVRAFTRNLEDVTHMFPELFDVVKVLKTQSCILDAEAIGYNPETEELLPFQETITRKRKHGVDAASQKVPIRFYVFDVLYSGNQSFLEKPLQERKDLLKELFDDDRTIKFTKYIVTSDPIKLREFHEKQLGGGLEGAVIKQINSPYQGGRKGWSWVKIKEVEGNSGKLKDTLDLVVMGYYYGRGKRSKFGVGAFLVGVLDEKQDIKTMAKIGTGLTDDQFRELKKRSDILEVATKPTVYEVEKNLNPDVWMRPELVVEIAADEITKSPNHTAGVALRFPRLVKFRDDKKWTDATTIAELKNF